MSDRPLSLWPGTSTRVERIAAFRLDNIGDVVMTGPALRALRERFPDAELTLFVSKAGAEVAPLLPWIDQIVVHRAVWQDVSGAMPLDPQRELAFVEELRRRAFDAAVIFTSFSQSPYPVASWCYLAGVPIRIGQSKEFGGSILSQWIRPLADDTHQVDRNLYLLEAAGFAVASRDLELRLPPAVEESARQLLAGAGIPPDQPYGLLAPGASCPARTYPAERLAAVVRQLVKQVAMPWVIVGSSREEEYARAIAAATGRSEVVSLVGRTSVAELCAVIRGADVMLGSHSGPMHLADAFNRPMVILFSGTDLESQWAPRRAPARLLRRPTPCAPCYQFTCPYAMECLDLSREEIAAAVIEVGKLPRSA